MKEQNKFQQRMFGTSLGLAVLTLSACSFVELKPGADQISVVESAENCQRVGQSTVSVLHEIGFYDRKLEDINEQLVVLAKNAALRMGDGANAVRAISGIEEGARTFEILRCASEV